MSSDFDEQAFRDIPGRIRGLEGIGYFPKLIHLLVTEARTEGDYLRIKCKAIETPSLVFPSPSCFELGARVKILTARPLYLAARYAGWKVFFDTAVIKKVISVVSQLPAGTNYKSDYTRGPLIPGQKFVALTPGRIASQLFPYVDEQVNHQYMNCENVLRKKR